MEAQNAEFSMNDIKCESAIAAPLHLVPSREEPAQTFKAEPQPSVRKLLYRRRNLVTPLVTA